MKHGKYASVSTPGFSGEAGVRGVGALGTAAHPTVRATDRWLLSVLQRQLRGAPIRLTLWDGTSAYASFAPPVGTVLVMAPCADRRGSATPRAINGDLAAHAALVRAPGGVGSLVPAHESTGARAAERVAADSAV